MDMVENETASADLELIVQGPAGSSKPETRLWLRMLSTTKLITTEIRRRLRTEFGATLPQFDLMGDVDEPVMAGLWSDIGRVKASARNHLSGAEFE